MTKAAKLLCIIILIEHALIQCSVDMRWGKLRQLKRIRMIRCEIFQSWLPSVAYKDDDLSKTPTIVVTTKKLHLALAPLLRLLVKSHIGRLIICNCCHFSPPSAFTYLNFSFYSDYYSVFVNTFELRLFFAFSQWLDIWTYVAVFFLTLIKRQIRCIQWSSHVKFHHECNFLNKTIIYLPVDSSFYMALTLLWDSQNRRLTPTGLCGGNVRSEK